MAQNEFDIDGAVEVGDGTEFDIGGVVERDTEAPAGGNAPTGTLYGPLFGPFAGPI